MFVRKLRVPLDIWYGLSVNNNRFFSMKEFKEKLSKMFDIANESVNVRQVNSSTYFNKKIKDEKLQVETLVSIYLPRNEKEKLTLKGDGPHRILSEKHPLYRIQINGKSKWLTRDKLHKCEQSISDKNEQVDNANRDYYIIEQNEHVQIETDSDSDSEIEDNDQNNNAHRNNVIT